MTTFDSKYSDRKISVQPSSIGSTQVRLQLRENTGGPDDNAVFAFLSRDVALRLVREVIEISGLAQEEVFVPEPKNAREVIEKLPVGATFTLDAGAEPTRYFRKRDETIIVDEYNDDRFEGDTKFDWNLTSYTGLFTGWSVDSLKLAEPRKTPTNQEIWEGMKRGDTFHFSDHPEKVHIKLSNSAYDHDGFGSTTIAGTFRSRSYTIVPKEESK